MLPITTLLAGLFTLIFIGLSVQTIRNRHRAKQAIGDGGDRLLHYAIRAHANFVEYVPFALVLLMILELNGAPAWLLYTLGGTLLVARISHAYSLLVAEHKPEGKHTMKFRMLGMALTFTVLGIAAIALLIL